MALQLFLSGASFEVFRRRWLRCAYAHAPCFLLVLSAALTGAVSLAAQNPQRQYVYASVPVTTTASEVAGFSKDGGTGVLSSIGTPLADALEGGAMTVDAKGRFLFIVNPNSNGISMFQIDPTTSALSEVFGSPFAAGPTANSTIGLSSPICLTTESSGQFLYVYTLVTEAEIPGRRARSSCIRSTPRPRLWLHPQVRRAERIFLPRRSAWSPIRRACISM